MLISPRCPGGDDHHRGVHPGRVCVPYELQSQESLWRTRRVRCLCVLGSQSVCVCVCVGLSESLCVCVWTP